MQRFRQDKNLSQFWDVLRTTALSQFLPVRTQLGERLLSGANRTFRTLENHSVATARGNSRPVPLGITHMELMLAMLSLSESTYGITFCRIIRIRLE